MALQGFTLYGLSYCMSYLATFYLTSGLVAVVFSTILLWNILNLRLFMRQSVAWRAFWGGAFGLSGICILFEDYRWTINVGLGVSIVLSGNLIILTPAQTLIRAYHRIKRI